MSFHIHCYGVDYTPECIQSCTRSRKFAWGPSPQHRCTLVWWQEHTSWHQHWNTARHPHTWLQGLKRFHKLPRAHHCTLAWKWADRHSFVMWCTDGRSLPWSQWMGSKNTHVLASVDNPEQELQSKTFCSSPDTRPLAPGRIGALGHQYTLVLGSCDTVCWRLRNTGSWEQSGILPSRPSHTASPEHQSIPPWALVGTPPWALVCTLGS